MQGFQTTLLDLGSGRLRSAEGGWDGSRIGEAIGIGTGSGPSIGSRESG